MCNNKEQKITEQNLNDIENAILNKILRNKEYIREVKLNFRTSKNKTFATLTWIADGDIHVKTGIASKRKGDKFNKRIGQIIALIKMQ